MFLTPSGTQVVYHTRTQVSELVGVSCQGADLAYRMEQNFLTQKRVSEMLVRLLTMSETMADQLRKYESLLTRESHR